MKNIIHAKTIPAVTLIAAVVAAALRLWTRGTGPDAQGLYPNLSLPWILLWVLTAGTAVLIFCTVRNLKHPGSYEKNFPRSVVSALCCVPAALSFGIYGYQQLRESILHTAVDVTFLDTIAGIAGMVAAVCLFLIAFQRVMGKKPFFLLHSIVSLYLAILLFNRCQHWDNLTQLDDVIFPLLASVALMLATYHRACFDVDMGKRPKYLLFCLMSVFLCIVSLVSFEKPLYYGSCALWMIGNLCSTRPLRPQPVDPEPDYVDTAEEHTEDSL